MDDKYIGMTVNERLFCKWLMGGIYMAVKERHLEKVILILKMVELTDGNIDSILKALEL